MPIHAINAPPQLYAQAKTALTAWYTKQGLKDAELAQKVERVLTCQFNPKPPADNALDGLAELE